MRNAVAILSAAVVCLGATAANAEPISVDAAIRTSGTFRCLSSVACTGTGTNTVVLGSGSNTTTLTFTGVDTSIAITNSATRVNLGTFTSSASEGFTSFPTRPNPNIPILDFGLTVEHSGGVDRTKTTLWRFGPGGRAVLPLMVGNSYVAFWGDGQPVLEGHGYNGIIYSFVPFPFSLSGNGMLNVNADVGLVPEPTTLLLAGSGLVAAFARRRRARA
jgi:hypothetical protein